jgi:hypothetical protein
MAAPCVHLADMPVADMPASGCVDCERIGGSWVHLRYCVTCEQVRCCDDSPNQHSRHHYEATLHPVIRSREPEEDWAWCYVHETGISRVTR